MVCCTAAPIGEILKKRKFKKNLNYGNKREFFRVLPVSLLTQRKTRWLIFVHVYNIFFFFKGRGWFLDQIFINLIEFVFFGIYNSIVFAKLKYLLTEIICSFFFLIDYKAKKKKPYNWLEKTFAVVNMVRVWKRFYAGGGDNRARKVYLHIYVPNSPSVIDLIV